MTDLLLLFAGIYLLNLMPAFAPSTWMVLSLVGFNFPQINPLVLALSAACAATSGRASLAVLSKRLIRNRLLDQRTRDNIDVLRETLEARKHKLEGALLAYSFTPLPSNYLFIAYGLTSLPLRLIVIPFFIGRLVTYSGWTFLGQEAHRLIDIDSGMLGGYLSAWFVVSQIGFLLLIYPFARIDWRALVKDRKFRWLNGKNPDQQSDQR